MYRVALRLTRNTDDAQDLVSDATLSAWKHFSKLRDPKKFRPWILRIITNTYISQYRKKKSRPDPVVVGSSQNTNEEFSLFDALATPFLLWSNNPEKIFLNSLLANDIIQAVDELPDEYRIIVTLCELEDLPYQQVATMLHIPIGTVRSRLHRGKSRLQKKLWEHATERGLVTSPAIKATQAREEVL